MIVGLCNCKSDGIFDILQAVKNDMWIHSICYKYPHAEYSIKQCIVFERFVHYIFINLWYLLRRSEEETY